jgi:16S rRNA (guanine1207-N2)-methyltransferase
LRLSPPESAEYGLLMLRDSLKTLFYPFEAGEIAAPENGSRVLFLGAEPGFRLPEDFGGGLSLVQGFRPDYRALRDAGYRVAPRPEGENFDAALVLCGRHRGQNENWVADAVERVRSGGLVVVAGGKEGGIGSLRKSVAQLVALDGQTPKYHGVAFWFRRPQRKADTVAALRRGNGEVLVDGRFRTRPGMFSHDHIDAGSRLLADSLPVDLAGAAADFCAGWGYLSAKLQERAPGIRKLDLYEADFESLEAAKANLASMGGAVEKRFFWHDLLGDPVSERYDAIVMNPPFHKARGADPLIGQGMIKAAAAALRRGGRLLMVANKQLPYEAVMDALFVAHQRITVTNGFKVLAATR